MNELNNPGQFIYAGKAIFTVQNENTGNRFTFKVKRADENKQIWFVSLLTGADNNTNYSYIGTVFGQDFRWTKKSKVTVDAPGFKAFDWTHRHIAALPDNVKVHHEGSCGRCGRRLTVPESIKNGIGPECLKKVA